MPIAGIGTDQDVYLAGIANSLQVNYATIPPYLIIITHL